MDYCERIGDGFWAEPVNALTNTAIVLAALLLTLASVLRRLGGAKIMLAVAGLFCVSVTFRSIDQLFCDPFPLGTHFAWHLLNAVMLYWLMRVLIGANEKCSGAISFSMSKPLN